MNKLQIKSTIKLLTFILILSFIIDKIAYYTITKISDHVYSGQAIGKLNQYLAYKDTTQTLVFGSSRANHHIDIRKLEKSSFNIGLDGKFIAHSAILIKMLPKDKKQNIILHLDPNVAVRPVYNCDEIVTLNTKYHTNDIIKEELIRADANIIFQDYYWCLDYNGSFLGIVKNAVFPKYNHKNYDGFDPLIVNRDNTEAFKIKLNRDNALAESYCKDEIKINGIFLEYLLDIINFCKTNDKNLKIITSPIFVDNCPDDNAILARLLQRHKIEYYDYSNFFNDNNDLKYWKDFAHMSNVGAEIFSEALKWDNIILNEE